MSAIRAPASRARRRASSSSPAGARMTSSSSARRSGHRVDLVGHPAVREQEVTRRRARAPASWTWAARRAPASPVVPWPRSARIRSTVRAGPTVSESETQRLRGGGERQHGVLLGREGQAGCSGDRGRGEPGAVHRAGVVDDQAEGQLGAGPLHAPSSRRAPASGPRPAPPRWRPSSGPARGRHPGGPAPAAASRHPGFAGGHGGSGRGSAAAPGDVRRRAAPRRSRGTSRRPA